MLLDLKKIKMYKKIIIVFLLVFLVFLAIYFKNKNSDVPVSPITSENTSVPSVTYNNASADLVRVNLPYPNAVVGKSFSVLGEARGYWFFEGSFPVEVQDMSGNILALSPALSDGEWMTEEFVPFRADITLPEGYIGQALLVLRKDNPSGESNLDASASFVINVEY